MVLTNIVLLDSLLLELSDPLSSVSCPPVHCASLLVLSSAISLYGKSLSPSSCCDHVPYSVADSAANVVLVEVIVAMPQPLPLPFVCVVYSYLPLLY